MSLYWCCCRRQTVRAAVVRVSARVHVRVCWSVRLQSRAHAHACFGVGFVCPRTQPCRYTRVIVDCVQGRGRGGPQSAQSTSVPPRRSIANSALRGRGRLTAVSKASATPGLMCVSTVPMKVHRPSNGRMQSFHLLHNRLVGAVSVHSSKVSCAASEPSVPSLGSRGRVNTDCSPMAAACACREYLYARDDTAD